MDAPTAAVLVPVKAFSLAKVRLAPALSADERAELARSMATTVVAAAHDLRVAVVCDDTDVADWAVSVGAEVVWRPGRGLDGAVTDGVAHLAATGIDRAVVAHADLPLADDLRPLVAGDGVTLVPDRRDDGTNVAVVPTRAGFTFAYGRGSFHRHVAEAERLGLGLTVVRARRLGWDVDTPADLDLPTDLLAGVAHLP